MMARAAWRTIGLAMILLLMVGCQPVGTKTSMMTVRPAELDRLDMWTGQWQATTETQLAGSQEIQKANFTESYRWACDRRVLINEWEGSDEDGQIKGIGIWTWDADDKHYCIWQVNNRGAITEATATYDENNKTWRLKGETRNTATGEERTIEANANMRDNNTMHVDGQTWYDPWKLRRHETFKRDAQRRS